MTEHIRLEGEKMKISICDDEKGLRLALRKVLECELQLAGLTYEIDEFESGEALLKGLSQGEPDILFLDIEMAGINGMEAARKLRKTYKNTVLIFVTAYPDFVFQGYEVHAFHYILKPYKEEKIKEVFRLALEETKALEEQYYFIEEKSGTKKLPLSEVHYFKSDRKKIEAVLENGREEFYGKLSDIEVEMPGYFVRIHNRYLVNLNYVSRVESTSCICAEEALPVSRGCKQELSVAFARMMLGGR